MITSAPSTAVECVVFLDQATARRLAQRAAHDDLTIQDELRVAVHALLKPREVLHPVAQGAGEWATDACDFDPGLPAAADLT